MAISCTHIPFERKNFLDFCIETKKKYGCGQVVHCGDLVDFHQESFHEHNPDGYSAGEEREIWNLPDTWEYSWNYQLCGVRYEHGTGYSGLYPQLKAATNNRQNTVIGHCHSVAGTIWSANDLNLIFGLSVGCGIDRMKYAFWYGRDFIRKPIIGCAVVLNAGKEAFFVPMKI